EVEVRTASDTASVVICGTHTNITRVIHNGSVIVQRSTEKVNSSEKDCEKLSIDSAIAFSLHAPLEKLQLVKESISLNRAICEAGLRSDYGLAVGKTMQHNVAKGLLSDDLASYVSSVTAAGTDARMAGASLPVMSNSGSGNQGIAVTMPVVAAADKLGVSEEMLLRAVTMSHTIAIAIKQRFGRLSALCGVTVAGASASAAITYMLGGDAERMKFAIQNTLGNVSGMLCDGAKAGCAMKVATCANAGVQSAILAAHGNVIPSTNGFIENDVEHTIDNFCRLGNEGSPLMDTLLLEMMTNKR
ncbi:MAG: serine dehydratase subunit alpha family protein, partial [Bacilli bacterium]